MRVIGKNRHTQTHHKDAQRDRSQLRCLWASLGDLLGTFFISRLQSAVFRTSGGLYGAENRSSAGIPSVPFSNWLFTIGSRASHVNRKMHALRRRLGSAGAAFMIADINIHTLRVCTIYIYMRTLHSQTLATIVSLHFTAAVTVSQCCYIITYYYQCQHRGENAQGTI